MVLEDTEESRLVTITSSCSSTHCELVALCLALSLASTPPQVLTDSLTSLRLARSWGQYTVARTLRCADRVELRQLIYMAMQVPEPPVLEKVKAHDEGEIAAGHPKALGNNMAD